MKDQRMYTGNFTKEGTQMDNAYMKIFSSTLEIKKYAFKKIRISYASHKKISKIQHQVFMRL